MMLNMAVKESVMRGDIEIGSVKLASGDKIISQHLSKIQRNTLCDNGMKNVSLDDTDYFSQVGNVANMIMINVDRLRTDTLESSALGYLGCASGMYLNRLYHDNINLPLIIASELCRSISMGTSTIKPLQDLLRNEWDLGAWGYENIDGWKDL